MTKAHTAVRIVARVTACLVAAGLGLFALAATIAIFQNDWSYRSLRTAIAASIAILLAALVVIIAWVTTKKRT